MGAFLSGVGGKIVAGVAALGILAGAYAWITTGAYNRGVKATVERMQVLIDKGKAIVGADMDRVKKLPPDELDDELRRLCEKHKKAEEKCGPR